MEFLGPVTFYTGLAGIIALYLVVNVAILLKRTPTKPRKRNRA